MSVPNTDEMGDTSLPVLTQYENTKEVGDCILG